MMTANTPNPINPTKSKRSSSQRKGNTHQIWYAAWSEKHRREYFWTTVETVDSDGNDVVTTTSKVQWVLPTTQGFYGRHLINDSVISSENHVYQDSYVHQQGTCPIPIEMQHGRHDLRKTKHVRISLSRRGIHLAVLLSAIPLAHYSGASFLIKNLREWAACQFIDNGLDFGNNDYLNTMSSPLKKQVIQKESKVYIKAKTECLEEIVNSELSVDPTITYEEEAPQILSDVTKKMGQSDSRDTKQKPIEPVHENDSLSYSTIRKAVDTPSVAFFADSRSCRQIDAYASLAKAQLFNQYTGTEFMEYQAENKNTNNEISDTSNSTIDNDNNSTEAVLLDNVIDDKVNKLSGGDSKQSNIVIRRLSCYIPFGYLFSKGCRKDPPFKDLENIIMKTMVQ